jgi:hypothetical protein
MNLELQHQSWRHLSTLTNPDYVTPACCEFLSPVNWLGGGAKQSEPASRAMAEV